MKIKIALCCWAIVLGGALGQEKNRSLEDELANFHIPGAILNGTELGMVIDALEDSYQKYSKVVPELKREHVINVNGDFKAKMTGKIPAQSFLATLYQVAGQTGCSLSFAESKVTLTPIPMDQDRSHFNLRVNPLFIESLKQRANVLSVISAWANEPETTSEYLSQVFRESGLFLGGESRVTFDPKSARLILSATKNERQRVEMFLKSMELPPRQIRVVSKIISGPSGLRLETGEFSSLDVQTLVRAASLVEGVTFLTLPSLVMLPGRSARIEVTGNAAFFDDDAWMGSKLHFELDLRGRGVQGQMEFQHRVKLSDVAGKVEKRALTSEIELRDQDTLIQEVTTKDGTSEYLMTTIEVIDATGRRVDIRPSEQTTPPSSK